jgi:FkbM family methyltransferase
MALDPFQYIQSRKYRGTVVVVGGHIGHDAIRFSRSSAFGRVVAVEGVGGAYNFLQSTLLDQDKSAPIEVLATFVSNRPELFLNVDKSPNDGKWFLTEVPVGPDSNRVSAITLDEVCANRENIDVIRISVDAHELEILESGSKTLRRHHPDICVEICLHHTIFVTRVMESHGYLQAETLGHMNAYFVYVGHVAVAISHILSAAPFWISSRLVWRWKRMTTGISMARRRWR